VANGDTVSALLAMLFAGVILQIVSIEYKTSGGRARPRETAKHLPRRGKKNEKRGAKADK